MNSDFHTRRKKGIGGSDVATILGISPWNTPYKLWLEKTGRVEPEDISDLPHVKRGIECEPRAREILEQKYDINLTPMFWVDKEKPWHRCSCDGTDEAKDIMTEIKCMGRKNHERARKKQIPPYYYSQMQWNMWVAKINNCIFASFWPEDDELIDIPVAPNEKYIKEMITKVDDFWLEYVLADKAPPLMKGDQVDMTDDRDYQNLAAKYRNLKDEEDMLKREIKEVETHLKAMVEDVPSITGCGIIVTSSYRQGTVDYKKVPALEDVDLNVYRKPGQRVVSIRRQKTNGNSK